MGSVGGELLSNMVAPGAGPAEAGVDTADPELSFQDMLASFLLDPELADGHAGDATEEDRCLISHEPLEKQRVKLPCGHSFNYAHIFAEVKRQKRQARLNDWPRVGDYAMKCPYCNVIHNGLLPPCEGYPAVANVNSPIKWSLAASPCVHVFARGKRAGEMCGARVMCGETRCKRHRGCKQALAAAATATVGVEVQTV